MMKSLQAPPIELTPRRAAERLRGTLVGFDGKQTCVLITPTKEGKARLVDLVRVLHEVAGECGIPPDDLQLGGPPIINAAIDAEGARSLSTFAALSWFATLLVSWRCFRSIWLTVLVFATGMLCSALSLAILWWSGVAMNAILLMMPQLVYVAAMSGAIHLVNYYLEALPEAGPQGAPAVAVSHAVLPLTLAAATTAIGLASLCMSDLKPIQQFGLFSAVGVVVGTVTLVLCLPSALQVFPIRRRRELLVVDGHAEGLLSLSPSWAAFARSVIRRKNLVALGCLALMIGFGLGLRHLTTSIRVEKFLTPQAKMPQDYAWIESHLTGLAPMEIVVRIPDVAGVRIVDQLRIVGAVHRKAASMPSVTGVLSAATFAPELPRGHMVRELAVNRRLERQRADLEAAGYLSCNGDDHLWRISLRTPTSANHDYTEFIQYVRREVQPTLSQVRLPEGYQIAAIYTGIVPVFNLAQRSLLDGMLFGFGADVALIVLAVICLLRHWSAGLIILLTTLLPATVVFGWLSWLGVAFDVGSVMTPSVAVGVTVDDVVHFLLWFRRGVARGLTNREAVMLAYQGCAKPMYQSWAVIGLGLSAFAFSSFVPSQRFGLLMVALLSAGMIGNLLLMPSLLAGPLGAAFSKHVERTR
jgi:predicted RND superfamily exporter protein